MMLRLSKPVARILWRAYIRALLVLLIGLACWLLFPTPIVLP